MYYNNINKKNISIIRHANKLRVDSNVGGFSCKEVKL